MRILAIITTFLLVVSLSSAGERGNGNHEMGTTILLKFNNEKLTVRLNDSPASLDLVAMLPMTLTFRDYNQTEKISALPKSLTVDGSPSGSEPMVGHVAYYAPARNLAIFYRTSRYINGLIPLGVIDTGVDTLSSKQGDFSVQIEAVLLDIEN